MNSFWFKVPFRPVWQWRAPDGTLLCRLEAPRLPDPAYYMDALHLGIQGRMLEAFTPEEAKAEAEDIVRIYGENIAGLFRILGSGNDEN